MIHNKVTKHKQAGIYECLDYKTNMETWAGTLKHCRHNRKGSQTERPQVSREALTTDYPTVRDTLGCFSRHAQSAVI